MQKAHTYSLIEWLWTNELLQNLRDDVNVRREDEILVIGLGEAAVSNGAEHSSAADHVVVCDLRQ